MITFTLDKDCILISGSKMPAGAFTQFRYHAQQLRLVWDPNRKCWKAPAYKYQDVKNVFEDIDTIDDKVDPVKLAALSEGKPIQFAEAQRRIPDYSLLNYPPMKGKAPNENFQHVGIMKGINKSCYMYAWSMGTGKSAITSAIIAERLIKYKDCNKVLLVTTNIGVRNLYYELFKFIKNLDKDRVAIGDKYNRLPFNENTDIVITSYSSFRLICNEYKKVMKVKAKDPRKPYLPIEQWSSGKAMLILDECHSVANPTSQQTKMMLLHAPLFKYRYLFSGTVADKPEKLWTQYQILDPWLNYNLSFNAWKDKMAMLGDHFSAYAIREWKKDELEKLNKRFLASYGNFYKTTDVLDLPDYIEKKIYCDMTPEHLKIYQTVIEEDLRNMGSFDTRDVVNRFPYMALSVDYPNLLAKHEEKFSDKLNKMIASFKDSSIEKYNAVEDILKDHEGEKGIIWCVHPRSIQALAERFKSYNPICIDGSVDQSVRFEMVEQFKKSKENQILIANIACLNTSVTILEATFQVYVERCFNYSQYEQSTRRIYRAGQTNNVRSYVLVYPNTIDTLLDKNLSSKGMLIEGLVGKNFLTKEQWREIFNCNPEDDLSSLEARPKEGFNFGELLDNISY